MISLYSHNGPGRREGGGKELLSLFPKHKPRLQVWEAAILDSNLSLPGLEPLSKSLLFFFFKILFTFFLERGVGREKHLLVASRTPPTGDPGLQPSQVPWWGIKPATFWFEG